MPYWFSAGYYAYTDNMQGLANHLLEFVNYKPKE